eukprot:8814029-Ditylum_brightwellii.AAC.1
MEASEDMLTKGFRLKPHNKELMIIEAHYEGIIQKLDDYDRKWIESGITIGIIDDEDEDNKENAEDD